MSTRQNYSSTVSNDRMRSQSARYFTIGDLAREFGVTLRSLRFYEDRGLLNPVREGLLRLYDGRDRTRLQVILKGKQLGFTLSEIRDMVGDVSDNTAVVAELKLSKEQIHAQIEHLERQQSEIASALTELRAQNHA